MTPSRPQARRERAVRTKALLAAAASLLLMAATADDPADRLADKAEESRARALFREIRCLQCQNQSIDDSEAPLAEDLRSIVRAQVAAGRTNEEIKSFIVARYGEFALETPSLSPANAVLWGAPFAVVFAGVGIFLFRRRGPARSTPPLTAEEEAKLAEISSTLT